MRKTTTLLAIALAIPAIAAAGVTIVGAAEVHSALVGSRAVVIDARSPAEFAQAHIPGAISIPAAEVERSAARLPKDRGTPLVFYCRGGG